MTDTEEVLQIVTQELVDALKELERWRSGQRTLSLPSVPEVPGAIGLAARLLRSQGGNRPGVDDMLREAAVAIRDLYDALSVERAQHRRIFGDERRGDDD